MKSIKNYSNKELLEELHKRGKFTNFRGNRDLLSDLSSTDEDTPDENWRIIITRGISEDTQECSRCRKMYPAKEFPHYQSRVSKNGFLQRSNAVCKRCSAEHKNEFTEAISNGDVGPKPPRGSVCSDCERKWTGNWHRHHQGDKFLGWICGHCNMSKSDHRNKDVMEKRKQAK